MSLVHRSAPRPRARNRRGQGGQLRDDILDAASRLLVLLGDEEKVTVRAVAAEVGVSPPSVYLHFPDKGSLIYAVCERLFLQLDQALEAATAGIEDPIEAISVRARAYVRFGVEHPEHYRVLFMHRAEDHPDTFTEAKLMDSAAFSHLLGNVSAMLASGRLRDELEPYALAIELWAVVHGFASLLISHPGFSWPDMDRLLDQTCAHLLEGVLRR